ncbi:MAG: class I SAM-dependent methyltransferase, partial [Terrimicrobiaceae bacterium]
MADHEFLKSTLRRCPVCDGAKAAVLDTQRFVLPENHPLGTGYDVVCCSGCGFAYADTAASQADYDRFYASHSKYQDARTSTGSGLTAWDAERLRETAGQIAHFEGNRAARIVDIGCANGGLLNELRARDFSNLCGLDPSEACARQTRLLPGVEAWAGGLSTIPPEAGRFDGIILSHVLEHVRDLQSALAQVRRVLQPGGWVYTETPDAMRYGEFVPSPFQDFNTEHINHFSTTSMSNLLRSCGFEPVSCGTKT